MTTQTAKISGRLQGHVEAFSMLRQVFKTVLSGEIDARARTFRVGESRSHIHWLVGHIAWATDTTGGPAFGLQPLLPEQYAALFGLGSTPDPETKGYPPLEDLMRNFDSVIGGLIERMLTLSDKDLDRPLPENSPVKDFFGDVNGLLHGTVFHVSYHLGQVSLLRRAQGLPSGIGV